MQFRFAFSLYFPLLGCSWDVTVGAQGRYEQYGQEGRACVSGVEVFYDAGPGAVVDQIDTITDPESPPTTFLYVALRTPAGEEIRRLLFRFGGIYQTLTVERVAGAASPFSDLLANPNGLPLAYFAHTDTGAIGGVAGWEGLDRDPTTAPLLMYAQRPTLLGELNKGGTSSVLAVATGANGGSVSLVTFPSTQTQVVDGGVLAPFPWLRGTVSDFVNYAEATPDGVTLHSVQVSDPSDTTSVTLTDATQSSFAALHSVGRVLFFQYVPKNTSPPPVSLPLLAVDLSANDLGPSAPARAPHVITPALSARQGAIARANSWMIATYSNGDYARVSLPDGGITPLPELAGATAFAFDSCNLYWVKKDSAVVMAMPLPGSAK
jgi:hypothetical protein